MAKKGKRGSSAARSAAAKKGWETRRRGGAAAKPTGSKKGKTAKTQPSKPAGKAPPPPAWSPAMKAAAGRRRTSGGPANAIKPSPRRLNAAEQAYMDITTGKGRSKFRSDAKVRAEMQRRGFLTGKDAQGQLIMIASRARRKKGATY
jgi:hypothetical protein